MKTVTIPSILLLLTLAIISEAFVVVTVPQSSSSSSSSFLNVVVDPSVMVDASIAVASAAAGAASQFPRIQQLERELEVARSEVDESELALAMKVKELEEKLYEMDIEYEQNSAKVRKQFDMQIRQEVEKVRAKVKEDMSFSLEIKMQEERSKMLEEKLGFLGSINGDKDTELVDLRLKQTRINQTNQKLEDALAATKAELEKIQSFGSKKKGWWPF